MNVGVSRQRLASLFRKNGIQLRPVSPSPTQVDEMARAYVRGESLEMVGSRLGFSADTVRKYLLKRSVAMRDTHGHITSLTTSGRCLAERWQLDGVPS